MLKIVLSESDDRITAIVRSPFDPSFIKSDRVIQILNPNFFESEYASYDILIHLAFARGNKGNEAIAESLDYTRRIFTRAGKLGVSKMIYISSQGVYGNTSSIREIGCKVNPSSVYAMAKYAGELLLRECVCADKGSFNILRLDNVIESQNLVRTLCRSAIQDKRITLRGGKQVFSYLNAYDAAKAVFLSYTTDLDKNAIYNVGPNRMRITLTEIGELVRAVSLERGNRIQVELQEDDTELWAGMDSEKFIQATGWVPSRNIYEMVKDIYIQTEMTI